MDTVNEQSIWIQYIGGRKARLVAKALKEAGYGTASRAKCTGYVINIAHYFEPGDAEARRKVLDLICEAAGIQPERPKS